jgi:ribosomal protein S18 acetylase RimI-like enzyme
MNIRVASERDLAAMYAVYYLTEVGETENISPVSPQNVPAVLRHVFETGTMSLAEQDGHVLAFAGAITRGPVTFLTDLFVHPQTQSGGLGKTLLQQVLPQRPSMIRCTMSSTDPRAQALYTRQGMQPLFPHFNLQWQERLPTEPLATDIEVVEGEAGDPSLVQWDAQIGGRARPVDHTFWLEQQRAVPLWFRRQGVALGYGYVRQVAETLLTPRTWVVGPLGVSTPEYATECVLAAIAWAQQRAEMLRIDVPGPHPCLAPLLERGFHIIYVETFHSTASFFDARCYIPSGSDLL